MVDTDFDLDECREELEQLRADKDLLNEQVTINFELAERLREENRELHHVIAQNLATYRANTAELRSGGHCSRCGVSGSMPVCAACWQAITHTDELRAGMAALVDALPKCDAVVRDVEPTPIGQSGWKTYGNHTCGRPATHQDISAWGGECPCPSVDNRCDDHAGSVDEAAWAAPLRAALRLLGR